MSVAPIVDLYRYILQPIAPFSFLGLQVAPLDLLGVIRLCVAMRQLREEQNRRHLAKSNRGPSEDPSFVRNVTATLLVIYGGEALTAPYLGYQPSFMLSGTFPMICTIIQAIVDLMPVVPTPAVSSELPLALLDGFTRAYLLCNFIPPIVTTHTSLLLAHSPWALLLTSLITANGGFFLVNLFSFLEPTSLAVQTPPEIQPYGWTAADLWCAPVVTGLYAFLTHAQPFWADLHNTLYELLGVTIDGKPPLPVDPEVARATCAVFLALLFTGRTARRFGLTNIASVSTSKIKTQ